MSTAADALFSHTPKLPEVTYELEVRGAPEARWRVSKMRLYEGLSEIYEATLELSCAEGKGATDALLGERCVLSLARGGVPLRRMCGMVRRVEDLGLDHGDHVARAVLVPELWILSQRSGSRVFQEMDVPAIVRAVLSAAGLYERSLRLDLSASYRTREMCVQYRETDLAFVARLLEDEGITYRFEHTGDAETLVLVDDVARFPDLATMSGSALSVVGDGMAMAPVEAIRRLDLGRQLNPTGVTLRDWDHGNPAALGAVLTNVSPGGAGPREIYEFPAGYSLRDWTRDGATMAFGARLAAMRQEEHRARDRVAIGTSNVTGLVPGTVLAIREHGRDDLNARHLLTRVEHQGEMQDELRARSTESGERYANRFTIVDARGPWRPPRTTPRPLIHGAQTATVVGPAGDDIHTDAQGRIRLLFHWDRLGAGDDSSAWVRVSQSWSGTGWGAQFIPRVGMEVVVTFLEGDPDRPLVTGCVYNGANPAPFALPGDKTRAGLRTRSSPGGAGFNELSFEDQNGSEQIYVHAQRDLDEVVERDHTLRAARNERIDIAAEQSVRVGGAQTIVVEGARSDRVVADVGTLIGGNRETRVAKDDAVHVEGARLVSSLDAQSATLRNELSLVGGNARREVAGTANERVEDDKTVQVEGNFTTIVGKHDAHRTFIVHAEGRAVLQSSELTEIASEKELILRSGANRIRITPERLELSSTEGLTLRSGNTVVEVTPEKARIRCKGDAVISADSVNILTEGAQVKLTDEAKITGSKVKLNPPKTDAEKDADPKPPKLTKLDFKDQEGKPLVNQRFVIRMDDGSEVAGVLDREGRSELELEGSEAKITFPDVGDVKPG